jgi:NtrC-family two-component system sensor histidine kinase KinB
MGLRAKILSGYGVVLSLTLVVFAWAAFSMAALGRASQAILDENYKSIQAANSMHAAIERQDSATLLVLLGFHDQGAAQFRENENQFLQWLGRARDNITVEGEGAVLDTIEKNYSSYLAAFSGLMEHLAKGGSESGGYYHGSVLPRFSAARDACVRLRALNEGAMDIASVKARTLARRAMSSTVGVGLFAILAGLVFSLVLSGQIVRPLVKMLEATRALAEGQYAVRVPGEGGGEIARLAASFNAMAGRLGEYHRMNLERIVAEERKSEAVLQSIDEGVLVAGPDFRILNLNPMAAGILQVSKSDILGRHFLEVLGDERLFALVREAVETGKAPEGAEIREIEAKGRGARHYSCSATPVLSGQDAVLGAVLLLRDVTRAMEMDRMKSEFIMTASHELRTPLHSLGMSIELLAEGVRDSISPRAWELLEAAREETARLKALAEDLLSLSRIEAGKLELDFADVPPLFLLEKAAGVFKNQAEEQSVQILADAPGEISDARADANKTAWVLTNLIGNALRHMPKGGTVRLAAKQAGAWISFSVSDTGPGIPFEYQSRIFDKFVQVKTGAAPGGTGLGLAICKEIVRAHKGVIWVESKPGEGSVFCFTLPAVPSGKQEKP